jgi:hypothetical protein
MKKSMRLKGGRIGTIESKALAKGRLRMLGDRGVNAPMGIERKESERGGFNGQREPSEGSLWSGLRMPNEMKSFSAIPFSSTMVPLVRKSGAG